MKYNFDEIIDRENTRCIKYDEREKIFGKSDVIPLWVADTDFRTPDFVVNAVKKRASHEIYGYPQKPDSFLLAIQSWLERRHNWKVDKEWIAYSPNVVISLASLIMALTKPGDKIVIQTPVYFPFFHVIEGNNRIVNENPLRLENGRYRFDLDNLKSVIDKDTRMLLLCNPHNPGGMVWTKEELTALGKICLENDVLVVSDEIHADLVYSESTHTPFAIISEAFSNNCITTMSASKTFNTAGLSASFLVTENKEYMMAFQKLMQATHISSGNFFGVEATEAAFTHGDDWLAQLLEYLESNRDFLMYYLAKYLPKLKVMKPEGTYLVWVDISELNMKPRKAFRKLVDEGLGLSPGYLFGKPGENYVRINIGCPRLVLEKALAKMVTAWKDL